ncbi:MAG: phage holin family protein, partial [Patescibacteria group bacterium]
MKRFFRGIFFYTVALFVASLIIPGFKLSTDIRGLLLCGFVLAILFMFVDPFFKLLLLPLNIMTMG